MQGQSLTRSEKRGPTSHSSVMTRLKNHQLSSFEFGALLWLHAQQSLERSETPEIRLNTDASWQKQLGFRMMHVVLSNSNDSAAQPMSCMQRKMSFIRHMYLDVERVYQHQHIRNFCQITVSKLYV